ncbi:hypothetical protein TRSC58_07460 [Trypanosoma rangeli SC58]|uniref:Uncharacterized protein n=1 Tax=Trypanosoma rangeli SC58 TaxID=429131 RepID=A0A061ISS7_TRYRA|nr:hypothetical protein TRSC58_07460 [Trypanosoma rangeli SC58]
MSSRPWCPLPTWGTVVTTLTRPGESISCGRLRRGTSHGTHRWFRVKLCTSTPHATKWLWLKPLTLLLQPHPRRHKHH